MTSTNNSFSHSFYDVITDVLLTMEAGAIVIAFWTAPEFPDSPAQHAVFCSRCYQLHRASLRKPHHHKAGQNRINPAWLGAFFPKQIFSERQLAIQKWSAG